MITHVYQSAARNVHYISLDEDTLKEVEKKYTRRLDEHIENVDVYL